MTEISFLEVKAPAGLKRRELKSYVHKLIQSEGFLLGPISIVFCSDGYLLEINKQYLKHDYFTDIITFDYSEQKLVSGDLLISLDRLKENAEINQVSLLQELHRVVFHGVLHLCGYKDKKPADKKLMTEKENFYLAQFIL